MRVLLTGSTGFLGAHTVKALAAAPVRLGLVARPGADFWRLDRLPANAELVEADLTNLTPALPRIREFKPDILVHAAWAGVTNAHRNDPSQVRANVQPTVDLLQACLDSGARHFVGLGSQAEYGPANRRISESAPTEPTTLYGSAKLATSILCKGLCDQAGARFAWLRVFSTYGPMEDPSWLIPYLTRCLLRGERPSLTACGQQWDYLFARDAAEAIASTTLSQTARGVFNLGSGRSHPLRQIVETIRDAVDPTLPLGIGEKPYRPDQVMHLEADIDRLRAATGWIPATSLESGLRETVAWHRSQMQK